MTNIKYQYAYNEFNQCINIEEVSDETRKSSTFHCISCGTEMSACLGNKRKHYFRHKTEVDCNLETYLHKMGKIVFVKCYKDCLEQKKPYLVSIWRKLFCIKEQTCPFFEKESEYNNCCESRKSTTDLTRYYDTISEEKRIGNLVPDVLLEGKDMPPFFIEIKVSHGCDENKIKSGYPIIEFGIQGESDLELLKTCNIVETNSGRYLIHRHPNANLLHGCDETGKAFFYNFKDFRQKEQLQCQSIWSFGIRKDNGKAYVSNDPISCNQVNDIIESHSLRGELAYELFLPFRCPLSYQFGIARAREKGLEIKSCYLCRYHALNDSVVYTEDYRPIFCKLSKKLQTEKYRHSMDAYNCLTYKPDKNAYVEYLDCYRYFFDVIY